ncbi:hypothetical protein [Thiolapillus sp.]|uniref:hypothetical protein n=1 Tax=Thiolapillus sp. TaxID=2017437 RepID=UPI0025D3B5AD|nr:hypothetical protein [Thiolapillus sp.]
MDNPRDFPVLNAFLADFKEADLPAFPREPQAAEDLLRFYDRLFSLVEGKMWEGGLDRGLLESYRQLMAELDAQLQQSGQDDRHHFIVVIPVADRPRHLQSCLESLLTLCGYFPYGKKADGSIAGISVLIADDSRDMVNIAKHKDIVEAYNRRGLDAQYFGQEEQLKVMDGLTDQQRQDLQGVLGACDAHRFYHKGASIMRNIACIRLDEMAGQYEKPLFYFVDSDQEFQVKYESNGKGEDVYAVNYFYHLDRIFSCGDVSVITGKVVGDPPVSPAVMAANFLNDVCAFLEEMVGRRKEDACLFHGAEAQRHSDAVYHDMADLFGYKSSETSFQYRCGLQGTHDHGGCFKDFAARIRQFFDGEHPTRKTWFTYSDVLSSTVSARTVYTGNYVFNRDGLAYFIPFATLKLRMAGPTLGRILGAELDEGFLSANLPMLHKRTVEETGQSEFRPGIVHEDRLVDLSGELERQYFGDVMLFSMEKLTGENYPQSVLAENDVLELLQQTERHLRNKYMEKHRQIQQKLERLEKLLLEPSNWWMGDGNMQDAVGEIEAFVANMKYNFGSGARGMGYIQSREHRQERLHQMAKAIRKYRQERRDWKQLLKLQ